MNFVFQRDRVIASTMGHAIEFKKGVPTYAPPALYQEILAAGGVPEEEIPETPETSIGVNEPTDPDERKLALWAAFEKLVLANKRGTFSAGGAPHPKVLREALGWDVDAREANLAWVEFKAKED